MAFRFPEDSPIRSFSRSAWHRFCGGRLHWHNRVFSTGQSIEKDDLGCTIRCPGRGEIRARHLRDLPRTGHLASILASGPSVRSLDRIERLFDHPVACVNGSATMAATLGKRADYYIVSDHRFILDQPDLFRTGTRAARATILCPMTVFTALLAVPDALEGIDLYLREDLRRPFKRPRPTRHTLRSDPRIIADITGDLAFSLDTRRGTCSVGTVVFDAVQILFGIGYRDLFMFGVDLSSDGRFYREHQPLPNDLTNDYATRIEPAFQLVAEFVRRSGNRLVNGSLGSRLPDAIIPKADGNALLDELERRSSRPACGRNADGKSDRAAA